MAAGRAGASLHILAVLQAYQADLRNDIDEGKGPTPEVMAELRKVRLLACSTTR